MNYQQIVDMANAANAELAAEQQEAVSEAFECSAETARDILGECRTAYAQGTATQPIYDWLEPHTVASLALHLASDSRFDAVDRTAVATLMFDAWTLGSGSA